MDHSIEAKLCFMASMVKLICNYTTKYAASAANGNQADAKNTFFMSMGVNKIGLMGIQPLA